MILSVMGSEETNGNCALVTFDILQCRKGIFKAENNKKSTEIRHGARETLKSYADVRRIRFSYKFRYRNACEGFCRFAPRRMDFFQQRKNSFFNKEISRLIRLRN